MEVRAELLRTPGGPAALYDGVPDLLLDAPKIAAILQACALRCIHDLQGRLSSLRVPRSKLIVKLRQTC